MGGFTLLAFSFCAALTIDGNQDVIALGYMSNGACIIRMELGDKHGDTVTIDGHEIGVEMIQGGAVVHIDELQFVIPKTEGV